jgi:glutamate 5-kinase
MLTLNMYFKGNHREFIMQKDELVVVKIGTSALSNAAGEPDREVLGGVVSQLAALKKVGYKVILVTSGAIGTGHAILGQAHPSGYRDDVVDKQIEASVGQPKLMVRYDELFAEHGLHVAQVLLEKAHFVPEKPGVLGEFGRVMRKLVGLSEARPNQTLAAFFERALQRPDIVPVVNENDTTATRELFTDNDELAGLLVGQIKAKHKRLLIISNVDGVYKNSPQVPGGEVLPSIDFAKPSTVPSINGEKSANGRGGMSAKLATAERVARAGGEVHIFSSREPRAILRVIQGDAVGTYLYCSNSRPSISPMSRRRSILGPRQ